MVERVARVLAVNLPEQYATAAWPEYVDLAREVIAAMREPTEAMLNVSAEVEVACPNGDPTLLMDGEPHLLMDAEVTAIWRGMIDAALKD